MQKLLTRNEIKQWLLRGIQEKQAYTMIVCDTFDYTDYPVYSKNAKEFWELHEKHDGKNMQRIMEVYDLSLDIDKQLQEHRTWHYPPNPSKDIVKIKKRKLKEKTKLDYIEIERKKR